MVPLAVRPNGEVTVAPLAGLLMARSEPVCAGAVTVIAVVALHDAPLLTLATMFTVCAPAAAATCAESDVPLVVVYVWPPSSA